MLREGGSSMESSASKVVLPEDPADPMGIMLRIAHLQFNSVPKQLGSDELLAVMALVDKYDMRTIVQPFCVHGV